MKKILLIASLAITLVTPAFAGMPAYKGKSFKATFKIADRKGRGMNMTIYRSRAGMRQEFDQQQMGRAMIGMQMKTGGACWYASEKARVYMGGKLRADGSCTAMAQMGGGKAQGGPQPGAGGDQVCPDKKGQKKLGADKVLDRPATKYQCVMSDGDTATVWIDNELKMVTRMTFSKGSQEMTSIKFMRVPSSSYNPPKGYRKVNQQGFMQAMMQSMMDGR